MTDAALVGIVSVIPPTLAALAAVIVSIRNGRKTDAVAAGQAEIHVLVNSNLEKVKKDLAAAISEIVELRANIAAMTNHRRRGTDHHDT